MSKVYVQIKNNFPLNADIQKAIDGFSYLDYDISTFTLENIVLNHFEEAAKKDIFVGSIQTMSLLFSDINKYPSPINIPNSIIEEGLVDRKIKILPLSEFKIFIEKKTDEFLFVKPTRPGVGRPTFIKNKEDILLDNRTEILVSEILKPIKSEYRFFIENNISIYGCCYKGDYTLVPDFKYIEKIIDSYKNSPCAYTIDVAILENGETTLIEVNDFWAIGSYGLDQITYARMLEKRYKEIINN